MEGFVALEDVSNFSGGLKSGSIINGIWHPIVNYKFLDQANLASMRFGLLAITYTRNQQLYTGASQQVSNLSAQREVRVAELNYMQKFNESSAVRLGIMDLREYLNIYDIPKEFINSGFGTNRVMSNSTAVATYPYPGFGMVLTTVQGAYGLSVAVFQGNPQHQSTVLHDGVFCLEEGSLNADLQSKNFTKAYLKLGIWQYYQPNPTIGYSNIGMYLLGQIEAYAYENKQIVFLAQLGYGSKKANIVPYSLNAGITISNLIPARKNDKLSFGYSQIWIRNASPEVVFEFNYMFSIHKNLFLKPDLQYIIKPNGTASNAFAGILRLVYNVDGHLLDKH